MGLFGVNKTQVVIESEKYRPAPPPGTPHSVALPGSKKEGRSAVYRHWRFKDNLLTSLVPELRTQFQLFEETVKQFPKQDCLGYRPYDPVTKTFGQYVWQDYATIHRRREHVGKGLVELHSQHGTTGTQYGVGLFCQNRLEWQLIDLGCMSQSLFSVSLYDTLGPESIEYIINHATLTCVATSLNHIAALIKLKPRCPTLKFIISLDPLTAGELPGESKADLLNALAADAGVKVYSIDEVEKLGEGSALPVRPPIPSDIITINYTSGTTGNPKGVVLTHENAVASISASLIVSAQTTDNVILSYLPLAHIFQRVAESTGLAAATRVGYFHGNVLEIVDDLKLLRPTSFISVPRLYNRFGSSIKQATVEAPGLRGALSRHVVSTKLANLKDYDSPKATNKHAIWDRIWSRKVVAAFGLDRAQLMVSGSAPLDPQLHQLLRIVFSNHFVQGYGLTESYATTLCQLEGDLSPGNCGAVSPCVEICLEDVPDMEYFSTDKPCPRGELLIRGPALFREYYRNEAETKKAMTADGWFHTGDICSVDEIGRFKIIDRKKNVLKLAHGEYVSPERIENIYLANCPWMSAAYVHGDSNQTSLVMIGAVMPEMFAPFAGKVLGKRISETDISAIEAAAANPAVQAAALKELDKVGRKNKFNSFERVRNVKLLVEPFTIENELLTPTLKLKRPQTAKKYRDVLDTLYEQVNADSPVAGMSSKL